MLAGMDFRADLYAIGGRFERTERFTAANRDEAKETARRLVVERGLDYAVVYLAFGDGRTTHIAMVGASR